MEADGGELTNKTSIPKDRISKSPAPLPHSQILNKSFPNGCFAGQKILTLGTIIISQFPCMSNL
jgi:hypothetical protein